jgi:hypothetical protein
MRLLPKLPVDRRRPPGEQPLVIFFKLRGSPLSGGPQFEMHCYSLVFYRLGGCLILLRAWSNSWTENPVLIKSELVGIYKIVWNLSYINLYLTIQTTTLHNNINIVTYTGFP